ncbi:ATP-binding cassette domain-containing protein [Aquicoccus sp. SCR17]|nr:ATP-binding cassette domain-containing protein [Carideicomes alvinocaridis]
MLEVQGLSAAYGQHPALQDVSLRLGRGEIVVILGANGAGKSTLLKAVSGICEGRVSGSVTVNGHEILGLSPHRIVEEGVALVPEGRGVFGDLTVEENLVLGAYAPRARDEEAGNLERVYGLFPKLRERRRQAVRTMSGGEQQMVAIGRAMMSNPAVLTLDEPSLGLSPLLSKDLFRSLKTVRDTGIGILLVEQNARASLAIADRGYLLENAHIIHEDSAENLATDPAVQAAYLGAGKGGAKGRAGGRATTPSAPKPAAPKPPSGPSPSEIAAQAMRKVQHRAPPKPAPAPQPEPPRPVAPPRPVPQATPKPAQPSAQPQSRPGPHGIDTADLVARAASASARQHGTTTQPAPRRNGAGHQTRPITTTPMPDLASHGDRLRTVLDEIEAAARRARERSGRSGRKP